MFGLEAMFFGACTTLGDVIFGTVAKPLAVESEQPAAPAPTKCLSCGAEKDARGVLPCGH
ncbi:hypothetical protein [Burkholderia sp. Ax-1719]|uniref:hypothetical protein n=1 Tax=Burkholderia sp. Ax-1719 TaxID=2608334 RepID=UPI001423D73B|nr:hypothetical protein [Burkholderia sp. Ax-1719]NIE67452.1 hypothetical protein [Burkholderia sp. Ax-1719]